MDNKNIFAANLKKYVELSGKSRREICKDLDINYYTFSDWINGRKYARMDKVELLANYFGILKSDLIEEKTEEQKEMQKKASSITDAVLRMKSDKDFLCLVESLCKLDADQIKSVNQMLSALLK